MAVNDLLQGFRVGADIYNQAAQLKEQRSSRQDQNRFRELQAKLEEERLQLAKSDSAATNEFRNTELAARIFRDEAIDSRDRLRIQQGDKQLEQGEQRLAMEGERLAAEMRRSSLEEAIAKEKITSMRYDNHSTANALYAYDDITATLAKTNMDLDSLSGQESAIKKLLDDAMTSNPNVVNTPNFKALSGELRSVMSQQQAIKDGHKLKLGITQQLLSNEKTAPFGVQMLREWGTQAKGGGPKMVVTEGKDQDGYPSASTRVEGDLNSMRGLGFKLPDPNPNPDPKKTGMPGGNNPVAAPQSTPGQAAAASVFNNLSNLNRVGAK